jgi:hypothetical protein
MNLKLLQAKCLPLYKNNTNANSILLLYDGIFEGISVIYRLDIAKMYQKTRNILKCKTNL